MKFEWAENKSDACFADRGFDFAYVIRAFADPDRFLNQDYRWDYGEERYRLLGKIDGRVFALVYTPRDDVIRIISARKANRREVQEYEKTSGNG